MNYSLIAVLSLCLTLTAVIPGSARAQDRLNDTLVQSRALAAEKKYDKALYLLEWAEKDYPDNPELHMAKARVLGWQRNFAQAQAELDRLSPTQKKNPDARLIQGYLHYYQKDYDAAEHEFVDIIAAYPDYADAGEGLDLTRRAQKGVRDMDSYAWQADFGMEYSRFTHRKQASWNQEFAQLTHFMDDHRTAIYGKVTRYDQFTNIDSEYEAGVAHSFAPDFNAYLQGTVTPVADFRPDWRIMAGGAYRVYAMEGNIPAIWLTLDARRDEYEDTNVLNLNPAVRLEPYDGWAFTTKAISVDQKDEKRVYGYELRLEGTLTPGWHFTTGYADAPETEAGITVDTKSLYGGMAVDITPAHVLRFGYARDDRDNSYIRHIYNASFGYRF